MNRISQNGTLKELLSTQNLGVLATRGSEYPYTSLIGFAVTDDLKSILFATLRDTRKYANILQHRKVSVLVNTGRNSSLDFKDAAAVTALGVASETPGDQLPALSKVYLSKFPFLEDFIRDPACVLVKVEVERFIVVTRFQEVKEIEVQ